MPIPINLNYWLQQQSALLEKIMWGYDDSVKRDQLKELLGEFEKNRDILKSQEINPEDAKYFSKLWSETRKYYWKLNHFEMSPAAYFVKHSRRQAKVLKELTKQDEPVKNKIAIGKKTQTDAMLEIVLKDKYTPGDVKANIEEFLKLHDKAYAKKAIKDPRLKILASTSQDEEFKVKSVAIIQEEMNHPDKFVLYQAADKSIGFIYQVGDLFRKVLLQNPTENLSALRTFNEAFNGIDDVDDFLRIMDIRPDTGRYNYRAGYAQRGASSNLSYISNYLYPGSSSIGYWRRGHSEAPPDRLSLLSNIFSKLGFDDADVTAIAKEFEEFFNQYLSDKNLDRKDQGSVMLQFFIDPSIVDKIAYISEVVGERLNLRIADEDSTTYRPSKILSILRENADEFEKMVKSNRQAFKMQGGRKAFVEDRSDFIYSLIVEVRLFLKQEYFNDPNLVDVHLYYNKLNDEKSYILKLNRLVESTVVKWLDKVHKKLPAERLGKIPVVQAVYASHTNRYGNENNENAKISLLESVNANDINKIDQAINAARWLEKLDLQVQIDINHSEYFFEYLQQINNSDLIKHYLLQEVFKSHLDVKSRFLSFLSYCVHKNPAMLHWFFEKIPQAWPELPKNYFGSTWALTNLDEMLVETPLHAVNDFKELMVVLLNHFYARETNDKRDALVSAYLSVKDDEVDNLKQKYLLLDSQFRCLIGMYSALSGSERKAMANKMKQHSAFWSWLEESSYDGTAIPEWLFYKEKNDLIEVFFDDNSNFSQDKKKRLIEFVNLDKEFARITTHEEVLRGKARNYYDYRLNAQGWQDLEDSIKKLMRFENFWDWLDQPNFQGYSRIERAINTETFTIAKHLLQINQENPKFNQAKQEKTLNFLKLEVLFNELLDDNQPFQVNEGNLKEFEGKLAELTSMNGFSNWLNQPNFSGYTPLERAIKRQCYDVAIGLLRNGANLSVSEKPNWLLILIEKLLNPALYGEATVTFFEKLIEAYPVTHQMKTLQEKFPNCEAIENIRQLKITSNSRILNCMLKAGFPINWEAINLALFNQKDFVPNENLYDRAIADNRIGFFRAMVSNKRLSEEEMYELLISKNASSLFKSILSNVGARSLDDSIIYKLFNYAIQYQSYECLKVLIRAKVNVNAESRDRKTPLMFAKECGDYHAMKMLVAVGAKEYFSSKSAKLIAKISSIFSTPSTAAGNVLMLLKRRVVQNDNASHDKDLFDAIQQQISDDWGKHEIATLILQYLDDNRKQSYSKNMLKQVNEALDYLLGEEAPVLAKPELVKSKPDIDWPEHRRI